MIWQMAHPELLPRFQTRLSKFSSLRLRSSILPQTSILKSHNCQERNKIDQSKNWSGSKFSSKIRLSLCSNRLNSSLWMENHIFRSTTKQGLKVVSKKYRKGALKTCIWYNNSIKIPAKRNFFINKETTLKTCRQSNKKESKLLARRRAFCNLPKRLLRKT